MDSYLLLCKVVGVLPVFLNQLLQGSCSVTAPWRNAVNA